MKLTGLLSTGKVFTINMCDYCFYKSLKFKEKLKL